MFSLVVIDIMGKKPPCDWFGILDAKKSQGGTSSGASVPTSTVEKVTVLDQVERPPSPEVVFSRKRKVNQHTGNPKASKMGKDVKEPVDPQADRHIPDSMLDLAFNLRHKIDFHFDEAKRKIIESTSGQKMAENCLELACRTTAVAWTLTYASNRGNLIIELEWVKAQLN